MVRYLSDMPADELLRAFEANVRSECRIGDRFEATAWLRRELLRRLAARPARSARACKQCGRRIEFVPPATRSTRQTCSDACRMKAYRARRQAAGEVVT